MSELSHHDDSNMNFKDNDNDDSKLQQNFNIIQPKRNVPIKTQIKHLEKELADLRGKSCEGKMQRTEQSHY